MKVVKESGLVCVSYGSINNDPEKVKLQVQEGIDAVIVDSVLAIRQGLTGPDHSPAVSKVVAPSGISASVVTDQNGVSAAGSGVLSNVVLVRSEAAIAAS